MTHTLRQAVLAAACAAVLPVAFIAAPAHGGVTLYDSTSQAAPAPSMMDLQWLSGLSRPGAYVIRPNPLAARGAINSYSLSATPIGGFTGQVAVGLTNEQNHSDSVEGFGVKSSLPGAVTLPDYGPTHYCIATVDSGSQAHIFTYNDANIFDFPAANREGTKTQLVQGASGTEELPITDAVGVYATGLQNATGGATLGVTAGSLRGQWNVPVLTANPEDQIPNIIGSPMMSQWQVRMLNSQTRHLTVGSTTFRSPNVVMQDLAGSAAPAGFSKVTLQTSDQGPPNSPYYINFDITGPDNPDTPGAWSSLIAHNNSTGGETSISRNGNSANNIDFMLDTGAQVTVISEDTARAVGFDQTAGSVPDFFVDVLGVGGVQSVPGIYLNSLSILGGLTLSHVPVLVLDAGDPRDPSQAVPGILGTNLFYNRDLIVNANVGVTSGTWFAYGPAIAPKWTFNGSGTWGDDTKWSLGSPDGADLQANFTDAITSAATITVDAQGFTAGAMQFDNANRYTIAGPGTITLQGFSIGNAQLNVISGSHTISAPVTFASDVDLTVTPATGSLILSGDMNGGTFALNKLGAGTLAAKNIRAGTLNISAGRVNLIANNTAAGAGHITALTLAGGTTPTVKLDLATNAMVIDYDGASPLATIKAQVKSAYGTGSWTGNGITSSNAAAQAGTSHKTAVGFAEASAIGSPATFVGQPSDSTSILLRYTYAGDANLDKTVDLTDFTFLATNFNGTGKYWYQGDFDYSGTVDLTDFTLLASNFNQTLPDDPALGATVPEPGAALGVTALTLMGLITRRRRNCFA